VIETEKWVKSFGEELQSQEIPAAKAHKPEQWPDLPSFLDRKSPESNWLHKDWPWVSATVGLGSQLRGSEA
jgi:hypothetical protein